MLLILKRGNEGDETAMAVRPNSVWRKELRKLAAADASVQGKAIEEWLTRVEGLVDQRHELMHTRWFRDASSAIRSPIGMRARRDLESGATSLKPVRVDLSAWQALAAVLDDTAREVWPLVREEMRRCGLIEA
jgi:hypothetical protein